MQRDTDPNGAQLLFHLHADALTTEPDFALDRDRDRRAGIRAVAAFMTVGVGAVAWVVALQPTNDMARLPGAGPSSFASFISLWLLMVAAMMLPGAAPAASRYACASDPVRRLLLFVGLYLAVWAAVGVALYAFTALYRPLGSLVAGAVVLAAGGYELTPLKQHFRRRCSADTCLRSGVEFGLYCVGSNIGLMLIQVALGGMNAVWMSVVGALMLAQKVLPAKVVVDVPLAVAIVGLGMVILVAPASVPGFMPPM